ncbi:MAG: FadR family transcriptional regulator [Myxococcales bacterium]|nr:FadR family transcriptional regulator [Myxococcales bacterium]
MLKPIQKTSLATSVFEQVRDLILSGRLEPGEPLPAERQLAESLGVNRSAVREALKRLEQAGLITIQHGGNTRVLDFSRNAGLGILEALLVHAPERRQDLVAFRRALFPEFCREAARRATAEDVSRLEMLAGLATAGDAEQVRDLTEEFWNVMVDASHNIAFRLVFNMVRRVDLELPPAGAQDLVELTNAVAAGDTRGAALAAEGLLA